MEDFDYNKLLSGANRTLNTLNKGERFVRNSLNDADRLNKRFAQKASVRRSQPYLGQGYRSDIYGYESPYFMSCPYNPYVY